MKVAILGTTLAGYVAAHAVTNHFSNSSELEIVMYGANQRPQEAGARFYEREIPGVPAQTAMVTTESAGRAEDYASKLNSPMSKYFRARKDFLAFSYWEAYKYLHTMYNHHVIQLEPSYDLVHDSSWTDCNYVINTAPRPLFYPVEDAGMFAATRHWRIDEAPDSDPNPYTAGLKQNQEKNLMIFDGTNDSSWFRISQLFGLMSVEWGFHKKPPIAGAYVEILPLGVASGSGLTNITPGWRGTTALAHVGAVARWEPSTDVGEVYEQTIKVLKGDFSDDDSGGRDS